jgi:prevent-host-death family protein
MDQVSAAALRKAIGHYLDRVERGEEISITRHGRVIAVLAPPATCKVDLGDMDSYYDSFDYYEEGNPVVEEREAYRS